MIKEFEAGYEMEFRQASTGDPPGQSRYVPRWLGKMSIDLSWVASARPFDFGSAEKATSILMAGSGHSTVIRCEYSRFMMLWMESRRTSTAST